MQKSQPSKPRKIHLFKYIIPIFILGISVLTFLLFQVTQIKTVIIIATRPFDKGFESITGKPIWYLGQKEIQSIILDNNPEIKSVIIRKQYPSTITVDATFRKAYVKLLAGANDYWLDEEGYLVTNEQSNDTGYPIIRIYKNHFLSGIRSDASVIKAINYISILIKENLPVKEVELNEDNASYRIMFPKDFSVEIAQSEDPVIIVSSLQTILSRFRIEGKSVSSINFMFDKPIVIFSSE